MTIPITIPDVLACVYLAQAAVGLRRRAEDLVSVPAAHDDEILGPLLTADRPLAAGNVTTYASRGPLTDVRLAAAVVLTTRVIRGRRGAPKPGPVRFVIDPDALDHEAFEFVAGSEFGGPARRSGGGDRELALDYGDIGAGSGRVNVAVSQHGWDATRTASSGLNLHFYTRSGEAAGLREGGPAERGAPDPVARQRRVPLVLDLMLGRLSIAPTVTRVVCALEATDPATDERLADAMELLTGK